jgi:iron complex outermembrane receptor protein
MKTKTFHKKLLPLSIAFIIASPVIAQEEEASDESINTDFIEQIIVTGTASGTAIRKVDASYASTSKARLNCLEPYPECGQKALAEYQALTYLFVVFLLAVTHRF